MSGTNVPGMSGLTRMILALTIVLVVAGGVLHGILAGVGYRFLVAVLLVAIGVLAWCIGNVVSHYDARSNVY